MFTRLLERLALALDRARIPYMVIGGQAVLLYGEPRLTKDIDVTLGLDVSHLADLQAVAADLRLKVLVEAETFTRQTMVLPCEDPDSGIRVDFIFSNSPYEAVALKRAKSVAIGDAQVRFAALEDLVIHKVVAGRPRDLEDVARLLRKNPKVDRAEIERRLENFSTALHEPFLDRWKRIVEPGQR
ncbi:MAG: nucleotidyl transferase AbiEii/AbiGii toxin family protein [Nitrospirota bacterium]